MRRIICIGTLLAADDAAGPLMFRRLAREALPEDVELIDGGTRGLDLLPLFDGAQSVILIDQVEGFLSAPGVVLLQEDELLQATAKHFDHQVGLGYLLQILPRVCEIAVPELCMLGIEGCLNAENEKLCLDLLRRQLSA
ncbi:MAG: hydrogenase maturation protease [Deltaproteobacteria bacterium]|nr:hydrogenase maturation protease [Deltaproteobacteria bacterium]